MYVRVEERGEAKIMLAERDGRAVVVNQVLSVRPVAVVEQDLSGVCETEPGRDTRIRGSIKSDSRGQAAASIAIDGTIEAGADLTAAEHVYIGKGVVGSSTKVKSKGNVECGFVQQAAISVVGDVRVAQHTIGAHIRAGGVIRFEGESPKGRGVIGGDLVAGREIHASSVQARGASTSLQILGDPRIVVGLRKVETTIEFCSKNTRRIIRTLGVDSVSQVKPLLRKMEPAARAGVMKLLKQLQTLTRTVTQAQDRRRKLEDRQEAVLADAHISVAGKIEADVKSQNRRRHVVVRQDPKTSFFVVRMVRWFSKHRVRADPGPCPSSPFNVIH